MFLSLLRDVTSKINTMEVGQVSDADSQRSVEDTTIQSIAVYQILVHCFF